MIRINTTTFCEFRLRQARLYYVYKLLCKKKIPTLAPPDRMDGSSGRRHFVYYEYRRRLFSGQYRAFVPGDRHRSGFYVVAETGGL